MRVNNMLVLQPIMTTRMQSVLLPAGAEIVGVISRPTTTTSKRFAEECVLVAMADGAEENMESRNIHMTDGAGLVVVRGKPRWLGTWFQKNGATQWHVFEVSPTS